MSKAHTLKKTTCSVLTAMMMFGFFISGCKDTAPPLVEVNLTNNTGDAIIVYYAREVTTRYSDNDVEQKITTMAANTSKTITTQPSVFTDGQFSVRYQSNMATYNPGTSTSDIHVTIETSDF